MPASRAQLVSINGTRTQCPNHRLITGFDRDDPLWELTFHEVEQPAFFRTFYGLKQGTLLCGGRE